MKPLGQTTEKEVQGSGLNPANAERTTPAERKRIPMNANVQKFEVDPLPGYHLHWPINIPARIARLKAAGYEFVRNDEVTVNGVAMGVSSHEGNMDLGDNVAIPSGNVGSDGQAEMHVLMKIKEEWYQESELIREERNEGVAAALRGDALGAHAYVDKARTTVPNLFTPKRNR